MALQLRVVAGDTISYYFLQFRCLLPRIYQCPIMTSIGILKLFRILEIHKTSHLYEGMF